MENVKWNGLIDNEGYLYDYSTLNTKKFFEIGDYLINKYKNNE
jgi:hypothetical protein